MFERGRRFERRADEPAAGGGAVATEERTGAAERERGMRRYNVDRDDDRGLARDSEAARRDKFGGFNWGAAFFGWLVAVGLAALLTALVTAAGGAIGLTELSSPSEATQNAETISLAGAIALLVVLAIAYFAGGYVAGRMSRFDGGRQGFGVWAFALLITIALAIAGAVLGSEYNLLAKLDLPRIPVDEGDLATGGIIALIAILLVTLFSAIAGGKKGEHYHRRVDRAGRVD